MSLIKSVLDQNRPTKIIIGASSQSYPGWIQTQREELDMLIREDWERWFKNRKIDCILAEMVWEHLTEEEGRIAAKYCYDFLKSGGHIRCSVPDGYFRNEAYQKLVQVGGPGPMDHPAAGHKIVYNYKSFKRVFESVGFKVDLLEYCDEEGNFHYKDWDVENGFIYRSKRFDHRNQNGRLGFVSLVIDAIKQ